jgi:NAD+ synthase (glutamine-hydrolysing)
MKIQICQDRFDAGAIENNTQKIIQLTNQAKKDGVDLIVFPELCIPGYLSLDLFQNQLFLKLNIKALGQIAKISRGIASIVGFVDVENFNDPKACYNSAAFIENGEVKEIVHKTLLPNYDIFYEPRYFKSGKGFQLISFKGVKFGIQICEDLWDANYQTKVSDELVKIGAELIVNISSSPFTENKFQERLNLAQRVSKRHKVPFIYVNGIGGYDGYDGELIFDGQSFVLNENSTQIYIGRFCESDFPIFEVVKKMENLRVSSVNYFKYLPVNNIEQIYLALVFGIKEYFRRTGFEKTYIGLSGGIDSAVTAVLAKEALGTKNVYCVSLPSKVTAERSTSDAETLAKNLGINFEVIPIDQLYNNVAILTLGKYLSKSHPNFKITQENIQARVRAVILMALSNLNNTLLLSTGNKTEIALGYTTLYGDMAGALSPLGDISKLKVYALAKFINSETEIIPNSIITRPPTAELSKGQTDEATLGLYKIISPLVDEIIESSSPIKTLKKKYPPKIVDRVFRLLKISEFKRRQAPPAIKVTVKAFGIGRKIPISHEFDG